MMLSYSIEGKPAKKTLTQEWKGEPGEQSDRKYVPMDWWFEDLCMLDMDYFVRTVTAIKAKGVSPDMIGAVVCNYAMKWLPGLAQDQHTSAYLLENLSDTKEILENAENENSTAKNRFILETLVSILPTEKDVVSCSFLLRLLRMAHIVGADTSIKVELERRVGLQLEQATVSDLLIPSFSHSSHTLFDVRLVYRLVKCFLAQDENSEDDGARMGRSSKLKVAKVLDSYLAEVAQDKSLSLSDFEALAEALPSYARTCDDGLYRAIDTYLKAHPGLSDTERKRLCRLMDCKKLSVDACMHAAQNERLPVRTAVHLLFSEQMKLRNAKVAGKTAPPAPNERAHCSAHCFDKAQCSSVRENDYDIRSLPLEIQKIRADFSELQKQCLSMQRQVDKLSKQKSIFQWVNGWKKVSKTNAGPKFNSTLADKLDDQCSVEDDFPVQSPQPTQTRRRGRWRRNSVS